MPIIEGMEYYLLGQTFSFKPNCKLKAIIERDLEQEVESFTLVEILHKINDLIKRHGMLDRNNQSIILCDAELEEALNMKALHSLELLSAVIEHVSQDDSFDSNVTNIFNSSYRISTSMQDIRGQNITQAQTITTPQDEQQYIIQDQLKNLIGLHQHTYSMSDLIQALASHVQNSPTIFVDARNPKIAFIEEDPLGKIFNMKAFHTSQIHYILSYFIDTDERPNSPLNNQRPIFLEESVQLLSHIYLTANSAAIILNEGQQHDRTSCFHFIPTLSDDRQEEEFDIPSAEETVRPQQAMGRTQLLSSADNTDTEDGTKSFAEHLNNELRSNTKSDAEISPSIIQSDNDKNNQTSSEDNPRDKNNSINLIFSTLRTAVLYKDITCEVRFPDKNKIRFDINICHDSIDKYTHDISKATHPIKEGHILRTYYTIKGTESRILDHCEKEREIFLSQIEYILNQTKASTTIEHDINNITKEKQNTLHLFKETLLRWNAENTFMIEKLKHSIITTESEQDTITSTVTAKPITRKRSPSPKTSENTYPTKSTCRFNKIEEKITHSISKRTKRCIDCRQQLDTNLPRCKECFAIRRQWLPERPRKRKKVESATKGTMSDYNDSSDQPETTSDKDNLQKTSMTHHNTIQLDKKNNTEELCWCCCSRIRNALLIHGKQGHQALCYPCAKKIWNTKSVCPICNRKIEKIVKIINV